MILLDSFIFGFSAGVLLNIATRSATYEPLSASINNKMNNWSNLGPFSYLSTGLVLGVGIWYYDYWRRRAIEEVLYADERRRYHSN